MTEKYNFTTILILLIFLNVVQLNAAETEESSSVLHVKSIETLAFEGKLYCFLRRPVLMHFTGIMTQTGIIPGQSVEEGDVIAEYELDQSRALQVGRQLLPEELPELRRRLESEKLKMLELQRKEIELQELTVDNLSPPYMLERLHKELEYSQEYISFLEERIVAVKKFESHKLEYIRNIVGDSKLNPGQIPTTVKVKAPVSGVVLSVHPQFKKDSLLSEGTKITEIGKVDRLIVRSLVYERDVVHLSIGDQVKFFPDSLPERSYTAMVTTINWATATPDPDTPSYYQVEMVLDNDSLELRAGFKGRVEYQRKN